MTRTRPYNSSATPRLIRNTHAVWEAAKEPSNPRWTAFVLPLAIGLAIAATLHSAGVT